MWEVSLQQSAPARLQLSLSKSFSFKKSLCLFLVGSFFASFFSKKEEKIHAQTT